MDTKPSGDRGKQEKEGDWVDWVRDNPMIVFACFALAVAFFWMRSAPRIIKI